MQSTLPGVLRGTGTSRHWHFWIWHFLPLQVKMWVQLLIPRIEDGNNFGVSIQVHWQLSWESWGIGPLWTLSGRKQNLDSSVLHPGEREVTLFCDDWGKWWVPWTRSEVLPTICYTLMMQGFRFIEESHSSKSLSGEASPSLGWIKESNRALDIVLLERFQGPRYSSVGEISQERSCFPS